jgi:hypothetical protein
VRSFLALSAFGLVVFVVACSNDSGGTATVPNATCDDNSGACAPQCIPYAVCTSEGSTCVIGGASCGHYWICHDTTWMSDTAQDCDSGDSTPDAGASGDATSDARGDGSPQDATTSDVAVDAADASGDDVSDDGATPDGDDGG